MSYADHGAIAVIASTTYMTIVELFNECSAPFSPEMMITIIDHNTNAYVEWHNIWGKSERHRRLGCGICLYHSICIYLLYIML